eukprot:4026318-Prymnesium_polylepis.1
MTRLLLRRPQNPSSTCSVTVRAAARSVAHPLAGEALRLSPADSACGCMPPSPSAPPASSWPAGSQWDPAAHASEAGSAAGHRAWWHAH